MSDLKDQHPRYKSPIWQFHAEGIDKHAHEIKSRHLTGDDKKAHEYAIDLHNDALDHLKLSGDPEGEGKRYKEMLRQCQAADKKAFSKVRNESEDNMNQNQDELVEGKDPRKQATQSMKSAQDFLKAYRDRKKNPEGMKAATLTKESVDALFEGAELSEEFKEKMTTIFESAVKLEVDEIAEGLADHFEQTLEEQTVEITEAIAEKVESYLNIMVEQWVEDNQVAVESGLKLEIFESFVNGMKTLFKESYIEIPEEKADVLEGLEIKVDSLQEQLNASMDARVNLQKQIEDLKKTAIIKEATQGLTDLDAEKLKGLAEDMVFESKEKFCTKLNTIKESFFANAPSKDEVTAVVTDAPVVIEGSINTIQENTEVLSEDVQSFVKALNTIKF